MIVDGTDYRFGLARLCTETPARGRNRYRHRNRFLLRHSAGFASTQPKLSLAFDPDLDSDRDPDQSSGRRCQCVPSRFSAERRRVHNQESICGRLLPRGE